jgi:hypothetical protein
MPLGQKIHIELTFAAFQESTKIVYTYTILALQNNTALQLIKFLPMVLQRHDLLNPRPKCLTPCPQCVACRVIHQNPIPLSVLHQPKTFPVSPTQSLKPSTTAFAIPCRLFFLSPDPPGMPPGSSLPIVGSTLSLADKLTKRANGTSQTHRPKYEAISVKVGKLLGSYRERGGARGAAEKCRNQR